MAEWSDLGESNEDGRVVARSEKNGRRSHEREIVPLTGEDG